MFNSLNGELVRPIQADRIAEAQYQGLVREARSGRPSRFRHLLSVTLLAAAHRIEPVRISLNHEAPSVRPELPCAISPC
jgi:hypothetical protein